jgi:hypothetical protein
LMQHILQLMWELASFYLSRTLTEQRQTFETSWEWYLKEMRAVCTGLGQRKELWISYIAGRFTELIPNNVKINFIPCRRGVH